MSVLDNSKRGDSHDVHTQQCTFLKRDIKRGSAVAAVVCMAITCFTVPPADHTSALLLNIAPTVSGSTTPFVTSGYASTNSENRPNSAFIGCRKWKKGSVSVFSVKHKWAFIQLNFYKKS